MSLTLNDWYDARERWDQLPPVTEQASNPFDADFWDREPEEPAGRLVEDEQLRPDAALEGRL